MGSVKHKDAAQARFYGECILDALDGTRLWRINMGLTFVQAHTIQSLLVYDYDCDGKAEVVAPADSTIAGDGSVNANKNYAVTVKTLRVRFILQYSRGGDGSVIDTVRP